ncbi:MAG: NAD(P)-dependent oxidoreductase, partial [Sphingomonas sp.]|nr:NAD(P)-dependent oxidoreductase [Sphingomonas sp.]
PAGRLSLIHVDDLGQLLISLAASEEASGLVMEPDDGRAGGWTHGEFGKAIGQALGRGVVGLPTPRAVLDICAKVDRLVRRGRAKLTPDRVAYFCHPDWTVDPGRSVPDSLWEPRIETMQGLADTVQWYRGAGWI